VAKKLDSIVELAAQKTREISANSGNYMAFLTTAAHNFKYNFRDQLLIYAQKPDATACAQIDFWNKHGRYVNRGTRGIALLVDTDQGYKLRYVFDMSDTNSRQGRTIPIWKMEPRYEDTVIEALENSYGEFPDLSGLAACLLETAKVIVEDNFGDYLTELRGIKEGSLLEELDDLSTEAWFKGLVESSVAFIMLTRCGIDPMDYFSGEDFAHVYDFDTPETLSILGGAVSDIAEMPLREIASTVLSLYRAEQRENRTFAQTPNRQYHDGRTKQERSVEHGTDIPDGGRLPPAQSGSAGGPEGRKIWDAAAQLPSDPQERLLHGDAPQRQVERPSGEDRPAGHGDGGAVDGADGAGAGRDGGAEGQRSDEVGGPDEQHPGSSGGSSADRAGLRGHISGPLIAGEELPQAPVDGTSATAGLQNSHHDFDARTDIPYYHEDSEKQELLRISDALKNHRTEIAAFFEAHEGRKERGDFIKGFFDNTYVEKILSNGQRAGYRAWDDVLNLWRGTYLSREKEEFLRWPHVADTIYGMILLHQWLDPDERPLPSEAEQVSLIEQAEAEKASAFILPQEAIDYVLCGRYSPSKLRIYDQYQKQESRQENAKFLKAEYGVGSYSNAIPSSGFRVDHDSTGITISRDYGDPDGKFLLTWAKVEKRIGELITAGRYLNRAEKEHYPQYRAQVEQRKARWDIAAEICSIIDDYVDFKTRTGETDPYKELLLARTCANSFRIGEKKCYVLSGDNLFVLPTLRNAMQTIIRDKTHLTERCEAVLADLSGPLATPLEPTEEELNPPPPPKKEYRLILGDTVYLGAQEYELLAYNEQTVRLYDPTFPIFNKELPREEFDHLLAENPLNDRLLQVAENAALVADAEEPDAGESPDAPLPVGRIDFLGTNGSVGESVEYTDAEQFLTEIQEENRVGAPKRIVLYRDGQGQTIPQDFLAELDPAPQGFEVIDMAQAQLERAKWLINAYCMEVFEQEADFSDLSHVPLAFSSTSDSAHTVEISADLVSFRLSYLVDGAEATSIQCAGFRDLNEFLANLDFDEMVASAEEEYNKQRQGQEHPADTAPHQAEQTGAEPDVRFYAVELDRGSQIAYGVWDDQNDRIYVDDEGVSKEFTSRWQAEEYARQLNQVNPLARYYGEGETILIRQYPNGQYYVQYCYDGQDNTVYATAGGFDTFEQAEAALYTHRPKAKKDPIAAQDLAYRQAAEYWSGDEHLVIFREPNGTFCNQYGFISGRVTPTTGSFATLEEAEKQLYADRPLAQKVQAREKPPAHAPADRDEAEHRYQVVVYHHLENGMDEKLEYATPEEAEQAARGYLEGTMEPDGFAYEGAAVYDLLEKKWFRVIGDFPTPEPPAAKEEQPPPPREDTEPAAADRDLLGKEITLEGRRFRVEKIDEDGRASLRDLTFEGAADFPIERVEHISAIQRLMEPAEKTAGPGKSVKSSADGHDQGGIEPTLAPPQPQRRARVSPFVLHPEVPNADRHEYHITDDAIGTGTPGERFNNNVRAIRLLKRLEAEDRLATPEEQEVLARYVGWGGLADCFDERHSKYAELKALLTEEEYAAARESTLTAFYTPPVVIRSIYQALTNMGFQTGNILEPSCGIGNFIGMRPEALADSKIYGVELDGISGRIAQQLYQQSSIAVQGFEKTDLPDSFFDAAIGNVPFGSFKVIDKRYDRYNFLIHDYFFARTLDKVRPGGVIAFVTSKGTMDKDTPTVRKYLAQRADLLGAIRLPNNTFKDAAGTDVTSDILFLQKRDALSSEEPDWVHLNTDANGLKMNQYFIDHSEMVMGEMREISGPYGPETACLPIEGRDLEDQLAVAIQNIRGSITEYVMDDPETEGEDKSIPADPEVRNFSYTIVDGKVYYRENSRMNQVEVSVTAANRIKGLIGIRDCVRTLIEYQTEDWPDQDIQAQQRRLNALYDAFVDKYGRINSRANSSAFSMDSAYFLLTSLEVLDDERNFVRKADMFIKRTIKQRITITHVDTASEALAVSLAEKAKVDMDYMAELTGKTEQEVYADLTGVIFLNPMHGYGGGSEEKYLTADEYLSGNVREKLEWAKRSAELYPEDYTAHVQALERVQPVDLTASEIAVRLGATWLPTEVIDQFIYELFGTSPRSQRMIRSHYSQHTGAWNIESKFADRGNVKAENTYGTTRVNGYKIIEETLNLRDLRIFDYVEDEHGNRVPILNKKETAIAQGKQELIKQAFQDWIWKDSQRRERLTRLYNDKFNSIRPREYDGSHLNFVGINPEITLRPHQMNAIAHILYGGNTLLAHVVGAGKTFEMVAAAQESKRLGLCQKSLFVVPNHLTEQWASEYLQLYPSANILVATRKDFETKNRKRFCGRIATGDYDAIIIGHSQFEKIPVSVERQRYLLEQQRSEVLNGIAELKANHGERFSIKQMERTKKSIDAKLAKLNDQSRKDDVVTFEELGIDRLFVDEAHYYKNLAAFSKMRNVGGISQTEAQKSSDLYMKCRYLDELTGGRGVVFATGTPISNTMVEMYTMQKYLQYHVLEEHGLLNFDAWASTFGETVTAIELAPEGTGYRAKTRFSRFYNLPELMSMFKEVADIQTADMLNLPVPKANYHNIVLKPSEQQKEMVAALGQRAEKVRNRMVDSTEDNMLLITNDGRKLALDQRLLNPLLPDSDTSKINACVGDVFDIWQRTTDQRSAQMVFCDLSTPGKNRPIEMVPNEQGGYEMAEFQNVYDDLRNKLIAKGIPAEEIAYIHSANTETQKKELFGKVRSGQVRVLIGSTQKMGAGTNVQKKLVALHHLDCPWRPSDLQQREGRIIRQGNENNEVDIYTYVTENTFDSYLYQLVEGKQKFIGQIMTSKSPVRACEDIDETALSYAEIKALCTGNPHIKEKMDLDIDVQRLRLLKANHLSQRYALEDQIIKELPQQIAKYEQYIEGYLSDMDRLKENTHPNEDGFSPMEVEGTVYTDKKAAGSAILAACKAMTSPEPVPLGQYRGFSMDLSFASLTREFKVTLKGALYYTTNLGTDVFGNILRLDNLLESMEERINTCREQLENTRMQLENAKLEVDKPFPQEDELKRKSARLDELNILLNMDKRESEIVDGDVGDEVTAPARGSPDRER
jgi:N12 class adenine-specific DNA methylase